MPDLTKREVEEIIESKLTEAAAVREAYRRGYRAGVAERMSALPEEEK